MKFDFNAELWEYEGKGAWHFIRVPKSISKDILELSEGRTNGFGSVKVEVVIGGSSWNTSIFPDSSTNTFIMPVKKAVRTAESIATDAKVNASIKLRFDVA